MNITGIEAAEYLADRGGEVTVVDLLDKIAPTANQTNVKDVCSRLVKYGVKFLLGQALSEVKNDAIVLKSQADGAVTEVPADLVVMSLGYKPDTALADELKARGLEVRVVGSAVKDGTIAPATRTGYEAARSLFINEKKPSFVVTKEEIERFGQPSVMDEQQGVYMAYLTDPSAIARILPPGLTPFPTPVVIVSACHIGKPNFSDDYYEAILGVYCMHKGKLGQYCLGLVLGGPGAEMATQCGCDNASIPKKLGADFFIKRDGDQVTVEVSRKGVQLIDAKLKLGEYNHPLTHMLFQAPAPGKHTQGAGFYYHFDRQPDGNGRGCFKNGLLTALNVEYEYKSWEPGFVDLKLNSSVDDPFAELPIRTIVGGAYAKNKLVLNRTDLLETFEEANEIVPYLLTARYDRTAFKESHRR